MWSARSPIGKEAVTNFIRSRFRSIRQVPRTHLPFKPTLWNKLLRVRLNLGAKLLAAWDGGENLCGEMVVLGSEEWLAFWLVEKDVSYCDGRLGNIPIDSREVGEKWGRWAIFIYCFSKRRGHYLRLSLGVDVIHARTFLRMAVRSTMKLAVPCEF